MCCAGDSDPGVLSVHHHRPSRCWLACTRTHWSCWGWSYSIWGCPLLGALYVCCHSSTACSMGSGSQGPQTRYSNGMNSCWNSVISAIKGTTLILVFHDVQSQDSIHKNDANAIWHGDLHRGLGSHALSSSGQFEFENYHVSYLSCPTTHCKNLRLCISSCWLKHVYVKVWTGMRTSAISVTWSSGQLDTYCIVYLVMQMPTSFSSIHLVRQDSWDMNCPNSDSHHLQQVFCVIEGTVGMDGKITFFFALLMLSRCMKLDSVFMLDYQFSVYACSCLEFSCDSLTTVESLCLPCVCFRWYPKQVLIDQDACM